MCVWANWTTTNDAPTNTHYGIHIPRFSSRRIPALRWSNTPSVLVRHRSLPEMWKLNLTLPIQIRWTPKRRRHSEPPPRIDDIASIPAMTGWNSLPVEIRLDIFKLVAQNDIQAGALRRAEHDDIEGPNKDKPLHLRTTQRLSHRSQVCQEWQAYFEPLIYESMTLDNSDLSRFRRVMKRRLVRLRFLRVVKLRMMLLDRDCRICSRSSHRAEEYVYLVSSTTILRCPPLS